MGDAGMLLAMGLAMMVWRPCRSREGRAPRAAIALLLLSAAAVWVGSLGVAVAVAAGEVGNAWTACGVLWRQVLTGDLVWWRVVPLVVWGVSFPLCGAYATRRRLSGGQRLLRTLAATGQPVADAAPTPALVVSALATPAVALGVARPVVLIDAQFWASATPLQRAVVLAHELAHARGLHALVDAVATLLIAPLRPLPAARDVYDCVRRHLEALADDVAVRRHGARAVGTAVGRIALASSPASGLGAAGACVWRVQRLMDPSLTAPWRDRALLVSMVVVMAVGLVLGAADTVSTLGPVAGADFCPLWCD